MIAGSFDPLRFRVLRPSCEGLIVLLSVAFLLAGTPSYAAEGPAFRDVTGESGLAFAHFNGMTGEYRLEEIMGAGGALFDFDGDGVLDLYLVQGAALPSADSPESPGATLDGVPRDRLLRGHLVPGTGGGGWALRFVDVSERSGIRATGYGQGVAVGDFTGNGCPDLYVTNVGANQLWRNECDGTFTDITTATGTGDPEWGTSATFADLTGDGNLDLFVARYVRSPEGPYPRCFSPAGRRDYCLPARFEAVPDRLFRNDGAGGLVDATLPSGLAVVAGRGLGVVAGDFSGDGRSAFYVANDGDPNHLWLHRGERSFSEEAILAGVAVNRHGLPEAGMGITVGDIDGSGREALFVTHLTSETNTLYVQTAPGVFEDRTMEAGLGVPSIPYTGFGTGFVDVDNDGWPDLVTVNGAVTLLEERAAAGDPFPFGQPNQLFGNRGDGTFDDLSHRAGDSFQLLETSRALILGDLDNDGAVDLVVTNVNGPARVLENLWGQSNRWVGLRFHRSAGGEVAGVRVKGRLPDGRSLHRTSRRDGSYLSASDPRILLGLGQAGRLESLEIEWPNGRQQRISDPPSRRYLVVVQPLPEHHIRETTIESCADSVAVPALRADLEPLCLAELSALGPPGRERLDRLRADLEALLPRIEDSPIEVAEAYGHLGRMAQAHRLEAIAEGAYTNAARLAPDDFRWPYLLAVLYGPQGRLREAREYFERALVLEPRYFPARLRIARDAFELGEVETAEGHYRRLLEHPDPEARAHAHEGLGQVAMNRNQPEDAVDHFAKALELRPAARALHAPLAQAHRALGNLDRAREHASLYAPRPVTLSDPVARDVWREPRSLEWLLASATRHHVEGRFDEALAVASVAVEAHPEMMRPRLVRALALFALGRPDEARSELDVAAVLEPQEPDDRLSLARVLLAAGQPERATPIFRRLAEDEPQDLRALIGLGMALYREGKLGQAEFFLREALERDPASRDANFYLGLVLLEVDSHAGGVQYLEKAYRLDPSSESGQPLALQWAASPNLAVRDGRRALALAQELFAQEPSVPHGITVALALAEEGRCDEAESWVRSALEAVEGSGDQELRTRLEALRETLREGPPCRPSAEAASTAYF